MNRAGAVAVTVEVLRDHHPVRDESTEQVVCWCLWKPEEKLWGFEEWDVVWEHVALEIVKRLPLYVDAYDYCECGHKWEEHGGEWIDPCHVCECKAYTLGRNL